MLDHRHQEILSRLRDAGRIAVSDIAGSLSVSEETVRRDLRELEQRGLLRRVHGGAVPPRLDQERPLVERGKVNTRAKARVGELAERLVEDGMSIFIDTGTTTLAFARHMIGRNVTVTTNSLDIALLLGASVPRMHLTPGMLRTKDNALIGYEPVNYVRRFFYDIAFMGIAACDAGHGWMDYEAHESVLRQTLRGQSRRPVLLADAQKFGRQAYLNTFALDERLTVVCDRSPPAPFADKFARHGIEVVHS